MTDVARRLDKALTAAGIPIFGVAIPDEANKATWRIDFRPEATAQQQSDAQAIVSAFVVDTPAMQYIRLHYANRLGFLRALKALEDGVQAHTVGVNILADLRSALTAAGNIIAGLDPVLLTHFTKLRDLLGLGGNISTMILADCQRLEVAARNWLNSRIAVANAAEDALE